MGGKRLKFPARQKYVKKEKAVKEEAQKKSEDDVNSLVALWQQNQKQ